MTDWADALTRPVAFVLSGGAALGAIQVGMLKALSQVGVEPDLVVGASVGSLNGAVLAEQGAVAKATDRLLPIWRDVTRHTVFPGGLSTQSLRLLRGRPLFPADGLRSLIERSLRARRFDELRLPFQAVVTETLTGHLRLLTRGDLVAALLASAAIPGVFPPVNIDGALLHDGGVVAAVPMGPAVVAGASSLVVLDAGDICHLDTPPRPLPDGMLAATQTALRQRVLIEAPLLAAQIPILYLPRPCVRNRSPLDVTASHELIEPSADIARKFLASSHPPQPGRMAGSPHTHADAAYQPAIVDLLLARAG